MKKISNIFALLLVAFGLYSCSNAIEQPEETKGYLQLEMTTVVSTNTRAKDVPDDYDSKTLEVRILDAQGKEVKKSIYKDGKFENNEFASPIKIAPGDYTVEAHSANWDGSNSGWDAAFYAGSADVKVTAGHLAKAKVILTQDNVKVEVFWDNSFRNNFKSATSKIEMSEMEGISSRTFRMGTTDQGAAYFPVGDLYWTLKATNKKDAAHFTDGTIKNLQPRDYVCITYSVKEAGTMDDINIYLDESTRTYTITIKVPRETTISLVANKVKTEANSESGWAQLSGVAVGKDLDPTNVIMKYKKVSDSEWTDILNNKLTVSEPNNDGEITYSYKLTLESSPFDYEYRLVYIDNGEESATSDSQKFRVNGGDALYNGGFELWHYETNNEIAYPTESESVKYWSSSNPGSGSVQKSLAKLTDKTTEQVHSGTYAARLGSKSTYGILAAASLYTGEFGDLSFGTQTATLNWGVPFTGRPVSLHGYMKYEPGSVDITPENGKAKDGTPLPSEAPGSGEPDHCHIFCALMNINAPLNVSNGDLSTFPTWTNRNDPRIVAYGIKVQKTTQNGWVEFDIPLDYYQTDVKPKYLIIVAASSKYGDFFHGSSKSVLFLDDFELRY